ncbi:hypothetical protein [Argonema galeatum]|uniref:hypothetical protein n=1 Tax=Argonema galeatum TaxID=2942762 RepID=UPI00201327DE|nr:hypothetical protein [Argonema galeatum]MCL1468539.1 hypothetical protein [Argonema galeatum A003/A1]
MSNRSAYFSKIKICILIGYLIPIALLLWFFYSFSVNVPIGDQWTLVNLFDRVAGGNANFGDFFAQNFEHRMLFPRIIFTILAFFSNWNIKLEQLCSICLAIISFYAMYKIADIQVNKNIFLFHISNIAISMLFFSLVQFNNWIWGFQLAWYLINSCVILAVYILTIPNKLPNKFRLLIAALCCFIASLSSFHGLLSWVAIIPSLAFFESNAKARKINFLLWVILFIVCCIIYSIGYQTPAQSADILFFLKKPLIWASFILMIVGTSSVGLVINPGIVGLFIIINFVFLNGYWLKNYHSEFARNALPWLSLGWFSALVALVISLGRSGYGVGNALQSRYTTGTILIVIACIQMWRLLIEDQKEWPNKRVLIISGSSFLFGALTAIFIAYSTAAIADGRVFWLQATSGKTCVEIIHYLNKSVDDLPDSCLQTIAGGNLFIEQLRNSVEPLSRLRFRVFPKDLAFTTNPIKTYGAIESPSASNKPLTLPKNLTIKVSGWAILPDSREQPRVVLFSYGDRKSFFANAVVKLPRPDVGRKLNLLGRYSKIGWDRFGWEVNISGKLFPVGETVIKAWVYDRDSKQFIKLDGNPKVKVIKE